MRSSRSPASAAKSSSPRPCCAAPGAGPSPPATAVLPPADSGAVRPSPGPLRPRALIVLDVLDVRPAGTAPGRAARPGSPCPAARGSSRWCGTRMAPVSGSVPESSAEAAQDERPDHAVAVDAAHGGYPRPADGLPVGDDGQGLERRLGEPYLLAVPDEPLHERRAVLPSIEAPAAWRSPAGRSRGRRPVYSAARARRAGGDLARAAARAPGRAAPRARARRRRAGSPSSEARRPGPSSDSG